MNLAASIESVLTTPAKAKRGGKDQYVEDSEAEAIALIKHSASQGRLASATLKGQAPNFSGAQEPAPAQPSGLAASVEAALNAPAPKKPTPVVTTQAPEKSNRTDTFYRAETGAPLAAVAETGLNVISGLGASLIGGWRGLSELARGGSMEDAAKAIDEEVHSRTYQPQTVGGKVGAEIMASPYNPLNWWERGADWAGGKVAAGMTAAGASPEVSAGTGSAVKTGIVAAPLLLLRGGKTADVPAPAAETPAVKPRIKLKAEALPADAGGTAVPAGTSVPATKPRLKLATQEPVAAPIEFAEVIPAAEVGAKLPAAEQAKRAQLLKRVGVDRARRSAIEGDARAAADDFQQSKMNDASGQVLNATLEGERQALTRYSERMANETGGTFGLDESARMARGNSIIAPLDSLKKWFDTETSKLYKAADEKAKGVPTELPEVHNFVKDHRARFLGNTEGKALLEGVTERMRDLGMLDKEGNPVAVTAAQAEKLNQYLGEMWHPRTGRLIGDMKDAILDGVARSAGEDVYKQARSLYAMRKATLDNPEGISKIMDASGPEGINRAVAVEKIADSVTALSVAQLEHVVKTLRNVPKEIQPQAQAALSDIKAQYANKILEIGSSQKGQWNASGVSKYLRANAEKMRAVFSREELAKFGDLNDAGHILAKDQSYPGAAVQEHNLVQRGAMAAIRSGGAAAGAAVGGPAGAVVGERIGALAAGKYGEGSALRNAQKRVVKISDLAK